MTLARHGERDVRPCRPHPRGDTGVASSYGRLGAAAADTPEGRVAAAMRRYPEMVAGQGRDVAQLMRSVHGLVAKDGAESVQLLGLPVGTGVAVKISDGGDRARLPITVQILAALGIDDHVLAARTADGRRLWRDRPLVLG